MNIGSETPWDEAFRTLGPLDQKELRAHLGLMWQRLMGEHGADQGPTNNRAARDVLYQIGSALNLAQNLSFILDDLRREPPTAPYGGPVHHPGDDEL